MEILKLFVEGREGRRVQDEIMCSAVAVIELKVGEEAAGGCDEIEDAEKGGWFVIWPRESVAWKERIALEDLDNRISVSTQITCRTYGFLGSGEYILQGIPSLLSSFLESLHLGYALALGFSNLPDLNRLAGPSRPR